MTKKELEKKILELECRIKILETRPIIINVNTEPTRIYPQPFAPQPLYPWITFSSEVNTLNPNPNPNPNPNIRVNSLGEAL